MEQEKKTTTQHRDRDRNCQKTRMSFLVRTKFVLRSRDQRAPRVGKVSTVHGDVGRCTPIRRAVCSNVTAPRNQESGWIAIVALASFLTI